MSTRKIIAAVVSVAILGSSIAVFRSSSTSYTHRGLVNQSTMYEGRPVTTLAPVVVYAAAPGHDKVTALQGAATKSTDTRLSPVADSTFRLGSQLHMPYYSFATNLRTLIKE